MKKTLTALFLVCAALLLVLAGCSNAAGSSSTNDTTDDNTGGNTPVYTPPEMIKGTFAVGDYSGEYEITLGSAVRAAYNATGKATVGGTDYQITSVDVDPENGNIKFETEKKNNVSFAVEVVPVAADSQEMAGTVEKKESGTVVVTGTTAGIMVATEQKDVVKNYLGTWTLVEFNQTNANAAGVSLIKNSFNVTVNETAKTVSGSYYGVLKSDHFPDTANAGTFHGTYDNDGKLTVAVKVTLPPGGGAVTITGTYPALINGTWAYSFGSTSSSGIWAKK